MEIGIVEMLVSSPIGFLYHVLRIPGTEGAGGAIIIAVTGFLTTLSIYKRTYVSIPEKLTVGRLGSALPIVGRIIISVAMLFLGSPWTSYLAFLNIIALPTDLICRGILLKRHRIGLATAYLANIPPLPPYILPIGVAAYTLVSNRRKTHQDSNGILLGAARYSLSYTPVEVVDRYGDLKNISRDWVSREVGNLPVYWCMGEDEGNPHIMICGLSGMGKSTLMYVLITRLLSRGYPITVIDPLGQYAKFAKAMEIAIASGKPEYISNCLNFRDAEKVRRLWRGVRIISVVENGMNVLEPVAEEPDIQVTEDLSYSLSVVERQGLGAVQHYLMTECALRVMKEASKKGEVPKLSALANVLENEASRLLTAKRIRAYEAAMNAATRIRLLSRYLEPDRGDPVTPSMLEPRQGEFENSEEGERVTRWGELVIVDLSGIHDDDARKITTEFLLRKLRLHIQKRRLASHKRFWYIVIDEAWTLMTNRGEYRSVLNDMIREVRNRGVAIALLTQRATDLDKDALANIGTKIYLKLGDEQDVEALVSYTGCHILREIIPQMTKHEGLILKRISSIKKVSEATLFRGTSDMILLAELRHLYIPDEIHRKAEEEIERRRQRERRRIEAISTNARASPDSKDEDKTPSDTSQEETKEDRTAKATARTRGESEAEAIEGKDNAAQSKVESQEITTPRKQVKASRLRRYYGRGVGGV